MSRNRGRAAPVVLFVAALVTLLFVPTIRLRTTMPETDVESLSVTGTEVTDIAPPFIAQLGMWGLGARHGLPGPPIGLAVAGFLALVIALVFAARGRWAAAFVAGIVSTASIVVYSIYAPAMMAQVTNRVNLSSVERDMQLIEGTENYDGELGTQGMLHPVGIWVVLVALIIPVVLCAWRLLSAHRIVHNQHKTA